MQRALLLITTIANLGGYAMWLFFALVSALLWTGLSLYDRFCVKAIFTRPAQGLFVAALFSGCGLVVLPFVEWSMPDMEVSGLAILAGLCLQFSQYAYFYALRDEGVGQVTAIGASYPVVVGLAAMLFGKLLTPWQWMGVIIVAGSVIALEGVKCRDTGLRRSIMWLAGYVGGLTGAALLLSDILEVVSFWSAFGPYCLGLIIGGLVPFIFSRVERNELRRAWPALRGAFWHLGLTEVVNIAALGCEGYALSLGHPALVTAAASTEPAWVFLAANFLSPWFPPGVFERVERVHRKILLVALIISGLGLLAWE